ncbi:ribonuclease J [Kyrpidia spormannii]|uniref:Ribonuclease J n=3 Tax=Kyrpidia TaxID=1129704 RepID=A0A2K8NAZ8_9BACL|nr:MULTISPECIES: ribonuclease J [Kyrpidia]ADG06280.1 RNA-metabolising metallo-beta-lactamase [Kyrpidia tusciae DSM 2912]ATY86506.1 ribonuclease J [Kyrpidia spormannii]CAB3392386.1 ribonuclease J1 [Kyrpidia spormannii]CAB3393312.1 ribonuclease J1 [Kyrpidia spormannii]
MSKSNHKLSIIPLGGLGEIGKNMTAYQYGNDIVVVDAGLKFPEEDMLGIDVVIPDVTYLVENKNRVRGIVLTHGHEDHIGGLPYVLKHINVPVYGTRLTLGLVEAKLREHNLLDVTKLVTVTNRSQIKLGQFLVSFFHTNHSIPDTVGIALECPEGICVHTGDFKFDFTPVDGRMADYHKLAELGERGVLCLLSDSTNAERPGYTMSERVVGQTIDDVFRQAEKRIILATFASNIHRIQQVIDAAERYGRKVSVVGRSMVNNINIAVELGYLRVNKGTMVDPDDIAKLPAHKVVILSTGSQGEPMSALTRMARATHRKVEIVPGDTVIVAASPIPGNEKDIARTIDQLFRIGANVIYQQVSGVHVSGHGSQEELKLMLNLVRPKYFIPVHGEFRMLKIHSELAQATGVPEDRIFILDNGDVMEFQGGEARQAGKVTAGAVLIDGLGVGDVGNIVLRDRKLLSQDGILVVVVTMSKQDGTILSGPDIISRGFVYVRESEALLEEANRIVTVTLKKLVAENVSEWSSIKTGVRDALGRFLYEQTRRRPMILPIIMEV